MFKIRCSRISALMTNSRSKSETLSVTAKDAIITAYTEHRTGKEKDIDNKYIRKGNAVEEEAITLLSSRFKTFFVKNEERFENEFLIGTPDIVENGIVYDVKSCWDEFTFDMNRFKHQVKKEYYGQLQGYMALTCSKRAKLVYCLIDTPDDEIERQMYYWDRDNPFASEEERAKKVSEFRFDYPESERIAIFDVEYDEEYINELYSKKETVLEFYGSLK